MDIIRQTFDTGDCITVLLRGMPRERFSYIWQDGVDSWVPLDEHEAFERWDTAHEEDVGSVPRLAELEGREARYPKDDGAYYYEIPKWSAKPPDRPGWYWLWRKGLMDMPRPVRVARGMGVLVAREIGQDPIDVAHESLKPCWWYLMPIDPPFPPPGDD